MLYLPKSMSKSIAIKSIWLLLCSMAVAADIFGQYTMITGHINHPKAGIIKCTLLPVTVTDKPIVVSIPLNNGYFRQELPINNTTFLSIDDHQHYYGGFIDKGDSIHITYDLDNFEQTLSFSSKASEKFRYIQQMSLPWPAVAVTGDTLRRLDSFFKAIDNRQDELQQALRLSRRTLGENSFHQLNAFLTLSVLKATNKGILQIYGDTYYNILQRKDLPVRIRQRIAGILHFNDQYADSYLYLRTVVNTLDDYYNNSPLAAENDLSRKYVFINQPLSGRLKSRVNYLLLLNEIKNNKAANIEAITTALFTQRADSLYLKDIRSRVSAARSLKAGMQAPDFTLENVSGEKINLAQFKNKVLLIDFWFATCGPCHRLFKSLEPVKAAFASDSNVVFLTISIDDRNTWMEALKHHPITGYHAFTENKFRDHPIIRAYNVNAYPTTFLIGKTGLILPEASPDALPAAIRQELESH